MGVASVNSMTNSGHMSGCFAWNNGAGVKWFNNIGGTTDCSGYQNKCYCEKEVTAGSATCTCTDGTSQVGTAATGAACTADGANICTSCSGDYWLNGVACEAWAECDSNTQHESVEPSNTQNRQCETKECSCPNGVGATGAACTTHGGAKCVSCSGDYWLNNDACEAWTECDSNTQYELVEPSNTQNRQCETKECACQNGVGATGSACPTNGGAKCASCNGDHRLVGTTCEPLTVCTPGQYETVAPTTTDDRQCAACTSGYTDQNNQNECTPHTACPLVDGVAVDYLADFGYNRSGTCKSRSAFANDNCAATQFLNNAECKWCPGTCEECTGENQYRNVAGTGCQTCNNGKSGVGCTECGKGKGWDGQNCVTCAFPQWNNVVTGDARCADHGCPEGEGATGDNTGVTCAPCAAGTFSDSSTSGQCSDCTNGWSDTGATTCSDYKRCGMDGTQSRLTDESPTSQGKCDACSNGYAAEDEDDCQAYTECPPGKYPETPGNATHNTQCASCAQNHVVLNNVCVTYTAFYEAKCDAATQYLKVIGDNDEVLAEPLCENRTPCPSGDLNITNCKWCAGTCPTAVDTEECSGDQVYQNGYGCRTPTDLKDAVKVGAQGIESVAQIATRKRNTRKNYRNAIRRSKQSNKSKRKSMAKLALDLDELSEPQKRKIRPSKSPVLVVAPEQNQSSTDLADCHLNITDELADEQEVLMSYDVNHYSFVCDQQFIARQQETASGTNIACWDGSGWGADENVDDTKVCNGYELVVGSVTVGDQLCTQPATTGYDFSSVSGNATVDSFSVTGIECANGYTGTATATVCTAVNTPYTVSGCSASAAAFQPADRNELRNAINSCIAGVGATDADWTGVNCKVNAAGEYDVSGTHISDWVTSNVTDMTTIFSYKQSFDQPLHWDVSKVTTTDSMFNYAQSFDQNLSNWDLQECTKMVTMFNHATSFNNGGVALTWSLYKVEDMSNMFREATSFDQDISTWDTSTVKKMRQMFYENTAFNNGGAPLTWDTSNVENMFRMFYKASAFNAPIGCWNLASVTDMRYMFTRATSLTQDLSGWVLPSSLDPDELYSIFSLTAYDGDDVFCGDWTGISPPSWFTTFTVGGEQCDTWTNECDDNCADFACAHASARKRNVFATGLTDAVCCNAAPCYVVDLWGSDFFQELMGLYTLTTLTNDDKPVYKQFTSDPPDRYLYHNKQHNQWYVSQNIGATTGLWIAVLSENVGNAVDPSEFVTPTPTLSWSGGWEQDTITFTCAATTPVWTTPAACTASDITCDATGGDISGNVGDCLCTCKSGYEGADCATSTMCDANEYVSSHACVACVQGFSRAAGDPASGPDTTCTDIDECALGTDDCHADATCTNNDSSFSCACKGGYTGDGVTCTDINECIDGEPCHAAATCTNNPGSFTCACNTGYTGDGVTCTQETPPVETTPIVTDTAGTGQVASDQVACDCSALNEAQAYQACGCCEC